MEQDSKYEAKENQQDDRKSVTEGHQRCRRARIELTAWMPGYIFLQSRGFRFWSTRSNLPGTISGSGSKMQNGFTAQLTCYDELHAARYACLDHMAAENLLSSKDTVTY